MQVTHTLDGNWGGVRNIALDEAGKTLVSSGSKERSIRVWDVGSGQLRHTLKGHDTWISGISVDSLGKTLISSGGRDKMVKVWDIATGELKNTLKVFKKHIGCVALSSDAKIFASGNYDKTFRIWDIDGKELGCIVWYNEIREISMVGSKVVFCDFNGNMSSWTLGEIIDGKKGKNKLHWLTERVYPILTCTGLNLTGAQGLDMLSTILLKQKGAVGLEEEESKADN